MTSDPLTILLVEDDDGHAVLVQQNLEEAGVTNSVVHARNGREALDYVWRRGAYAGRNPLGPLLFLLDISMPVLDGVETLRRLKADPLTAYLPVIILTTTDEPREVILCYELGCSSYATKPVESARFVGAVRRRGLFLSVVQVPPEKYCGRL